MKVLFCGDIVGRAGRDVVVKEVPRLRARLGLDFVVVNGENAAAGFGITAKICQDLHEAGVDVITGGNHSWDNKDAIAYIAQDRRLLRPVNFPPGTPGFGSGVYETARRKRVAVINVMCRLFMDALDDPFQALEAQFKTHRLAANADFVLVDVHGEATSEKQVIGYFCDGRASLVVGTHTHVPTADARLLPKGTAYQTDAGMCGDYDSVIGMKKEIAMPRMIRKMPGDRLAPAEGEATLCAVYVETDDRTGLAVKIAPIRIGGQLASAENV
ncbi:MAG: TIGR00282 family metallophosphoesterase [Rhodospirillales bacterium]|nr:MAG: TIGR00282 family metallophosphoesterase [Rhodospirillales bacterium]